MEVQLLLICVALAAFASVVAIALRRVVVAKPNEWLLVIANGEMAKAVQRRRQILFSRADMHHHNAGTGDCP